MHRVDASNDPDLFWAVRGSGGATGVVTALEFDVLPLSTIYAGALFFPLDRAETVVSYYAEWVADLDEAATTCIRLLRLPPMPDLPDFLHSQSVVMIDGAIDLPPAEAERLRALGPTMDTFAMMPAANLDQIHLDPPDPVPVAMDGLVLAELTPPVIEALLEVAGPTADTSLLAVELRQLGGGAARRVPGGGCVDHLPGAFLTMGVGFAPPRNSEAESLPTPPHFGPRSPHGPWIGTTETSETDASRPRPSIHLRIWPDCAGSVTSTTPTVSSGPITRSTDAGRAASRHHSAR